MPRPRLQCSPPGLRRVPRRALLGLLVPLALVSPVHADLGLAAAGHLNDLSASVAVVEGAAAASAAAAGARDVGRGEASSKRPGRHVQSGKSGSPASSLLYVLIQTLGAIFAGWFCVRRGIIDGRGNDMKAVRFIVGRLSLPLMSFQVIATSSFSNIDLGIVLACSAGKVLAFIIGFVAAFCFYRSRGSFGRRFVTATLFGFFQMSTNDFAIGLPVIEALYGPEMSGYMAANILVFQLVMQPGALIALEIANSLAHRRDLDEESVGERRPSPLVTALKSIATNPIVLFTVLGVFYLIVLPSTRQDVDGKANQLPHPIYDLVSIFTQPFKMLFLFLNGASLTSVKLSRWAALLVVTKVVVCAFVTYLFAEVFIGKHTQIETNELQAFAFYYGSIPTGGAPLVFAMQFAPWAVETIASSCLYSLVLAGLVEFMTALVLGSRSVEQGQQALHSVQYTMSVAGIVCGVLFTVCLILTARLWDASRSVIGIYGMTALVYSVGAFGILALPGGCGALVVHVFGFLQTACNFLVLYLHFLMTFNWAGSGAAKIAGAFFLILLSLLPPFLVTLPHTLREMCGWDMPVDHLMRTSTLDVVILLTHFGLFVYSSCLQPRGAAGPGGDSTVQLTAAARMLVLLQCVRLFMEAISSSSVALWKQDQESAFLPMFILVNIMELGQGCVVLGLVLLSSSFQPHVAQLLVALRSCGLFSLSDPAETASFHEPEGPERPSWGGSRHAGDVDASSVALEALPPALPRTVVEE